MIQDIRYSGYTTNPSDYDSPDGDLALSLNLLHEEGSLKPIFQPTQRTGQLPSGVRILCIHTTTNFAHYIIHNTTNNKIGYIDAGTISMEPIYPSPDIIITSTILDAKCIGNIANILCKDGVHKLYWNTNDHGVSGYSNLSTALPECKLQFGLKGHIIRSNEDNTVTYKSKSTTDFTPNGSVAVNTLTEAVTAAANRLIAYSHKYGSFCMPFFVRYAYRLYDGSLTMQSAPILMIPTSDGCPIVFGKYFGYDYDTEECTMKFRAYLPSCKLDYSFIGEKSEMLKYSDIIKSVDVFVSSPFYSYNQDGKCEKVTNCSDFSEYTDSSFGIFALDSISESLVPESYRESIKKYSRRNILDAAKISQPGIRTSSDHYIFELPKKSDNVVNQQINDCSSFFFIHSIPIEELKYERTEVKLDEYILQNLEVKEAMTDDYDSHDLLSASSLYTYNSRLLLSNVSKNVFDGYYNSTFAETNLAITISGSGDDFVVSNVQERDCYKVSKVVSHIKRDSKVFVVSEDIKSVNTSGSSINHMLISSPVTSRTLPRIHYFYHPDPNVYKVEICGTHNDIPWSYIIKPSIHDTLNGSYFFDEFKLTLYTDTSSSDNATTQIPSDSVTQNTDGTWAATTEDFNFNNDTTPTQASYDKTVSLPNRIYVSEVNNPFVFSAPSIVSVGSGSVIGVSTAAQALSQGQFGSFPLYAFTTDGVWALSVSSTGAYSAVQPITRDVCINAKSITQLDGSVLFASDRGIINLSGSQVNCISDAIFTDAFDVSSLPKMDVLHALLHTGSSSCDCIKTKPFLLFVQDCQMIYDYINQHVIIYNPSTSNGTPVYRYAYVLSLKSLSWGMIESDIEYSVDSYPHAMAVDRSRHILTYDGSKSNSRKALFVTRPIKMGNGDVLKSIHSLLQRGNFNGLKVVNSTVDPGDVDTVLYGSRDMANWHIVASSKSNRIDNLRGTPYKYYRIAGFASLTKDKSISGATIDVIPRETTKVH